VWGREYWYVCACIALGGRRMIGSFSDVRGECGCLHVLSCVCVCVCVAGEADGWERAKRTSCHCGSTNWRCCDICAGVVCYPHPHASEHAWCTIEVRAWARTPTTFTSLPPFAYTHAQTISFPCVTLDFGVCLCVCVFVQIQPQETASDALNWKLSVLFPESIVSYEGIQTLHVMSVCLHVRS